MSLQKQLFTMGRGTTHARQVATLQHDIASSLTIMLVEHGYSILAFGAFSFSKSK